KLSVVDPAGGAEWLGSMDEAPAGLEAVAHRVVHGGDRFREPVVVDPAVREALGELSELAPLHNGPALEAMDRAQVAFPDVPHVAVFDTAFHATILAAAATYAVPRR